MHQRDLLVLFIGCWVSCTSSSAPSASVPSGPSFPMMHKPEAPVDLELVADAVGESVAVELVAVPQTDVPWIRLEFLPIAHVRFHTVVTSDGRRFVGLTSQLPPTTFAATVAGNPVFVRAQGRQIDEGNRMVGMVSVPVNNHVRTRAAVVEAVAPLPPITTTVTLPWGEEVAEVQP